MKIHGKVIHIYIICQNQDAILPQGLNRLFSNSQLFRVNVHEYGQLPLNRDKHIEKVLPMFIWQQEQHNQIYESINLIRQNSYSTDDPVLILCNKNIRKDQIQQLAAMGKTGIIGFDTTIEKLHNYIQELFNNSKQWVFSPDIIALLIDQLLLVPTNVFIASLSKKEMELLDMARQGYSMKQTAQALQLSKNTIAVYRSKMLKKAGVKSMAILIAKYINVFNNEKFIIKNS